LPFNNIKWLSDYSREGLNKPESLKYETSTVKILKCDNC